MGLVGRMMGAAWSGATGGVVQRAIGGAVVGGALQAATNTHLDDNTSYAGSILGGAMVGAAAGVGSRFFTPKLAGGFKMPIGWKTSASLGIKGGLNAAAGLGRLATTGVNFAIRHPYLTMGGIGAGIYSANNTSPYSSPGMERNPNAMYGSRSSRNRQMMESTFGLTFGLHNGRH